MSNNFDTPILLDSNTDYFGFGRAAGANQSTNARMLYGEFDPAVGAGLAAPLGSTFIRGDAGNVELLQKTGALDTDWTEVASTIAGPIELPDNDPTALVIRQGANNYMVFDTTDLFERITFGNAGAITPAYTFNMRDNDAQGFRIQEGVNPYITILTTNGMESIVVSQLTNIQARLTTTAGIAGGTPREVGGRAFSNTADSAAVTNTTVETAFDQFYTVPANTLGTGTSVRIRAVVRVTADNAADTLTLRARIGGSDIVVSSAVDVAAGDTAVIDAFVITRAAPGAAVDTTGGGTCIFDTGAAGTLSTATTLPNGTTVATNAAVVIDVTAQWSAANTANSCFLESLLVEVE